MVRESAMWAVVLGLVVGCGPGGGASDSAGATDTSDTTDTSDSTDTTGQQPDAFAELDAEYEACGPPLDPLCVGLECAVDDVTTKYMTMVVEELEDAGVAGRIRAINAKSYPDSDQLLYQLQAQVEWYRYWQPDGVRTTDPDDEVRAEIRGRIESLAAAVPADIIDRELVTQEAAACDGMTYTLCTGHVSPGAIMFLREMGDPCDGGRTDEFSIDLVTGESTCTLDAPVSCG